MMNPLLPALEQDARVASTWYVLHVKPRTEKKVMAYLARCSAWRYLPIWVKETRVQRRKVRTELPLFPGYVFARMNPDQRLIMLRTNLIVRTIEVTQAREMIHQLRQIARAGRLAPLKPLGAFQLGDHVRVKSGPFYGLTGYVDAVSSELILAVSILGRGVSVTIDPQDCERI